MASDLANPEAADLFQLLYPYTGNGNGSYADKCDNTYAAIKTIQAWLAVRLSAEDIQIARLTSERDSARQFAEAVIAKYNRLRDERRVVTCVYCGFRYAPGTPPSHSDVLTEHIRTCEKHPLRAVQEENARLKDIIATQQESPLRVCQEENTRLKDISATQPQPSKAEAQLAELTAAATKACDAWLRNQACELSVCAMMHDLDEVMLKHREAR